MANALYNKAKEGFLEGQIAWLTDNIKVALVDTGAYTVDLANDEFYTDLSGVVDSSANLTGKTSTGGVADANSAQFTSVTGSEAEALVVYQDTGTPATSRLIAYIDTAGGLPVTPNGGDISVTWPSDANRIFSL